MSGNNKRKSSSAFHRQTRQADVQWLNFLFSLKCKLVIGRISACKEAGRFAYKSIRILIEVVSPTRPRSIRIHRSCFGSLTDSGKPINFHRDSKYIERVSMNSYERRWSCTRHDESVILDSLELTTRLRLVYTMETGTIESGLQYRDWVTLSGLGYTFETFRIKIELCRIWFYFIFNLMANYSKPKLVIH